MDAPAQGCKVPASALSRYLKMGFEKEHLIEILRSARGVAAQAEVFSLWSRGMSVQFEANALKQVQTKERSNVVLRIFREGRIGLATAGGGSDLDDLVEMAVETSRFGRTAEFDFPSAQSFDDVETYDPAVTEMGPEAMIEIGNHLIARLRDHTPDLRCDVEVARAAGSHFIANSRGGEGSYDKSLSILNVRGILVQDTDMLFVGDSVSSCRVQDTVEAIADRVIGQLDRARRRATVSARTLPVIFTPLGVASVLLGPLALAFNHKTVIEGASPLRDRQGEQVFDKRLSLWDDATVPYGAGSYPLDDEGVPGQRLPLVASGLVTNFFSDLQTAASASTHSTGNGRRAGGAPAPAMSSVIIAPGTMSLQSMVEDIKTEGLIVEQAIGAGQGNTLGGDFGGNVLLGYKVENGEIVGRVKDTMIAGNVFEVLGELLGIGQEARWVGGVLQTPPLYCPRVSVATKGG